MADPQNAPQDWNVLLCHAALDPSALSASPQALTCCRRGHLHAGFSHTPTACPPHHNRQPASKRMRPMSRRMHARQPRMLRAQHQPVTTRATQLSVAQSPATQPGGRACRQALRIQRARTSR
jgi:hypothetical protein